MILSLNWRENSMGNVPSAVAAAAIRPPTNAPTTLESWLMMRSHNSRANNSATMAMTPIRVIAQPFRRRDGLGDCLGEKIRGSLRRGHVKNIA